MTIKTPKFLTRWFGDSASQYEPGTGRITMLGAGAESPANVTVESALAIPAIFHGLRTIAQTIGSLDFNVIHHLHAKNDLGVEQSRQEIARTHPVHILLHSEPNEFQNASEWRELMVAHAALTGNGYSFIERNGNHRATALLPLLPGSTKPVVKNGTLFYITNVNGKEVTLTPDQVFHVKGFSWNGISGMPLYKVMKQALGLDLAQSAFATAFYHNGANMGGVVQLAGELSEKALANLKSSMQREQGGLSNAFKTLYLEQGHTYAKTGVEPDKAQFIEGRKFSLGDLARIIGVAPHMLYDLQQSTNNNIEHQGIEAVTYTFKPWTIKFTQEANRKLLFNSEMFEYSTEINTKPLMAGDSTAQAAVDTARFNAGATTPNEIRAKDGKNPIPGGDSVFINTALMPLELAIERIQAGTARLKAASSTAPAVTTPAPTLTIGQNAEVDENDVTPSTPAGGTSTPTEGPAVPAEFVEDERASAAIAPVVRDAINRIIKRESKAVDSALKRCADSPQKFSEWFATWQQEHRATMAEMLQPAIAVAAVMKRTFNVANYIDTHIAQTQADVGLILAAEPDQRSDAQWSTLNAWHQDRPEQAIQKLMKVTQ